MNSLEVIAEEGRSIVTSILSSYPYKLNQVNSIKRHVTVNGFRLRGTMVPGDSTNVSVVVNREATACFRNPVGTKVAKCSGASSVCTHDVSLAIHDHALLVYTPDLTTCFHDALYEQNVQLALSSPAASVVFLDWYSSGRKERDAFWSAQSITSTLNITMKGVGIFSEKLHLPSQLQPAASMKVGTAEVYGTLFLSGPKLLLLRTYLGLYVGRREQGVSVDDNSFGGPLLSVTNIAESAVLVRFIFPTAQFAYDFMHELLQPLSQDLDGMVPFADRVLCVRKRTLSDSVENSCEDLTQLQYSGTQTKSIKRLRYNPMLSTGDNGYRRNSSSGSLSALALDDA